MMHLFYTCIARKKTAEKRGKPLYNNGSLSNPEPIADAGYVEADDDDFPF